MQWQIKTEFLLLSENMCVSLHQRSGYDTLPIEIKVSAIQTLTFAIPAGEELTKQWGSAESPQALQKVRVCLLHWQAARQSGMNGAKNNLCLFRVYGSGVRISHSLSHLILMIWVENQYNMEAVQSLINSTEVIPRQNHGWLIYWPFRDAGKAFVPPIGPDCLDLCNGIQGVGGNSKDRNNKKRPLMDSG